MYPLWARELQHTDKKEPDVPPTQCRQPALHQQCNENKNFTVATRIKGLAAQVYSGNTTGTSGEQRKFLNPTHPTAEAAEVTELTGRQRHCCLNQALHTKGKDDCSAEWSLRTQWAELR